MENFIAKLLFLLHNVVNYNYFHVVAFYNVPQTRVHVFGECHVYRPMRTCGF